ncbi:hypothetical protein [Bacilliculturomica massiliensis]|nr:hypothetical protein [Bacilliculturomica massiliensis]
MNKCTDCEAEIGSWKEKAPAGRPSEQGALVKDHLQDTAVDGKSQGGRK